MIRELKRPRNKSDAQVIGILTDALKEARENKVVSVAVALVEKDITYSTFCITTKGTFCETIGTVERLKEKIMDRWKE